MLTDYRFVIILGVNAIYERKFTTMYAQHSVCQCNVRLAAQSYLLNNFETGGFAEILASTDEEAETRALSLIGDDGECGFGEWERTAHGLVRPIFRDGYPVAELSA
jgi:hypothetical protein